MNVYQVLLLSCYFSHSFSANFFEKKKSCIKRKYSIEARHLKKFEKRLEEIACEARKGLMSSEKKSDREMSRFLDSCNKFNFKVATSVAKLGFYKKQLDFIDKHVVCEESKSTKTSMV